MFSRNARGLLDFSLALLCLWTAWHHTPAGALVRRASAWAFGGRSTARPLLAYYDGVSGTGVSAPTLAPGTPPLRPFTGAEALAYGTHLALKGLSPAARAPALALAQELGIPPASLLDAARGAASARRLHEALAESFPQDESRLTAVFAGRVPARYALERVAAEGGTPSLERLSRQLPPGFEDATVAAAQALALATAFGLAWPVPEHTPVSSPFGYRLHPVLGVRKLHTGVDLSLREGSEVHVVADGVVRRASEDDVNGKVLVIDHGRGVTTAYCHNSELLVRRGQRVARGELISLSGNTGRSTGPHLHYQLELAAQPVDPLRFRPRRHAVADETVR
ncbi:M23 family metallopeptidase [Archangium lipolyticum]|uniref:M23 family metallopeptidase n=1 Tax=Archangium lipolyticum TaxID=2970465 RepID=UPI00214A79DE|nr:M23 family metallopeptidase [Archangium lipolyticum]